jgi:predicted nucleotidyltransferase
MSTAPHIPTGPSLEQALEAARRRIEVSKAELDEARRRRDQIGAALRDAFPGSRVYVNGSIAHGDALYPLTDVDLGVVVPDPDRRYGPAKRGPKELKDQAAKVIRTALASEYPKLRVIVEGRKRSILVSFGSPVTVTEKDFTADVIVAIDNPTGGGLYIPRYNTWDRAHPEMHTAMVRNAVHSSEIAYARVVRLLKHWARRHDKPLSSWHIKALALGCLTTPTSQLAGLLTWFDQAIADLRLHDTPDPAGVASTIKSKMPRAELVDKLIKARNQLAYAIELEANGYDVLARDELAKFFNDEAMLPREDQGAVVAQEITRRRRVDRQPSSAPTLITGVMDRQHTATRSWAE